MTWPKVKLGDVCEVAWGNTSITKSRYMPEGYLAYSASGPDGFLDWAENEGEGIVLSAIGARCGKCFFAEGLWTAIKNTITIKPNNSADARYLFRVLNNETGWTIHGAGQPFITLKSARQREIPLPPIAEQKRLASILDAADALRQQRRETLRVLDELAQSLFLELFGDPATNPKGWEVVKLGELTTVVSSGSTPLGGSTTYLKSGTLFIRSQNVLMKSFDFSEVAFISEKVHNQMRRTWVKNGDVLFNITGASIGRVNYFEGADDSANVNQHVCIIRTKKERLSSQYLRDYLATETFQKTKIANNNGATRQAFNFQQIKEFPIPLPPLALQQQFASQIEELEAIKRRARESSTRLDALFACLQARAFAGELSE